MDDPTGERHRMGTVTAHCVKCGGEHRLPLLGPGDEPVRRLRDYLQRCLPPSALPAGQMFGVLLADGEGGAVTLPAFSGRLDGRWEVSGWAPPLAPGEAIAHSHQGLEAEIVALSSRIATEHAQLAPELEALQQRRAAAEGRFAAELTDARAAQRVGKKRRAEQRRVLAASGADVRSALRRLDDRSRREGIAIRNVKRARAAACEAIATEHRAMTRELASLKAQRRTLSRRAAGALLDAMVLTNGAGQSRGLRELFAGEPPTGAGECCAPKLLVWAARLGLRPRALGEMWWGPSPPAGGREHGVLYPPCAEKCAPLMPFLLCTGEAPFVVPDGSGLSVEILDRRGDVVVLSKPPGLLSVPGRSQTDSVQTRLRDLFRDAQGFLLPHRLDLDTSGVMVAGLNGGALEGLARQFRQRTVEKRYVAVVAGCVREERGTVSLPIAPDRLDPPRQRVDRAAGREAVTHWEVIERARDSTRLALLPITGRAHQLRVHVAALGHPILGDRLYGDVESAPRLLLHAEAIAFDDPNTGERIRYASRAPF